MTHLFFIFYLLIAIVNAHPMWSKENDDDNNGYGDNQDEESTENNNDSSENESPYDNQNSDNRRDSPYNFNSHSEQSEFGGYDSFRPATYNGFADNRMYDQPYDYNNQRDRFQGSNDYNMDYSNGNDFSNENTDDNTENDYRRDEADTESYYPGNQGGYDYRALKRKTSPPRFKPTKIYPSTNDYNYNRNPYERRSDSERFFAFGGLGTGGHNKHVFNIHNKIIYTK